MILYMLLFGVIGLAGAQNCPNQWLPYQSQCFRFVYNSQLSWHDARDFCLLHGGDLLKIQTVAQRNWVVNRARTLSTTRKIQNIWWTGLNNLELLNAWGWADGMPANDTLINWSPGEPNNRQNQERCGSIWTNNRVNDESCDHSRSFICSRNRGDPVMCDADRGWQTLNHQCYRVYTATTSWRGAQAACNRNGGGMVTIDNFAVETTVHELAATVKVPLWLGLHSIKLDTDTAYWMWTPNQTLMFQQGYWQSNRPPAIDKAHLNSTCVVMSNLGTALTAWYPQYCGSPRAFVCVKPEGMCLPGWIGHRSICYQFNPHFHLGFTGAADFCQSQGAELAHISSSSDQSFLNTYLQEMSDSGSDSFWIGLSDNNHDNGSYIWRNRQVLTTRNYRNWATAHNAMPNNTQGKMDCVFINTNDNRGKWRVTQSCESAKSFICTIPMGKSVTAPPSTPIPVYGCPNGWKLHSGTCFLIVSDSPTDAFTARQRCQNTPGADLARVDSADLQVFLNGILTETQYFIGLNDRHSNNVFTWNDDNFQPQSNYTNWIPKEPNDYNHQESCVVIYKQQWNDVVCTAKLPYICSMLATSQFIPPVPTQHTDWTVKCGIGWESNPLSDSCYLFSDEPLEWIDARLQCQAYGGDIVSIGSLSEQNYIAGRLQSMKSLAVWTGANDRKTEGGWNWATGEGFAFLNWAPGQPGGAQAEGTDCVAMLTTSAQWDDIDCQSRNGYVCEKRGNVPTTTPPAVMTVTPPAGMVMGCHPGWLPFQNSCYLIQARRISWDDAATFCAARNSHLATVVDTNEQNFLVANIPKSNVSWYGFWIGLNDKKIDNSFQWMDGSPITYTNWANNEPNSFMNKNEDCTLIFQQSGMWNDEVCSRPMQGLVCKSPKGVVSVTQSPYQQGCPINVLGYGPYCYWFVGWLQMSWTDANAKCNSSYKGTLATVNDRYLQAFLATQMVYRTGNYWIGLSDMNTSGTFRWLDGTKMAYTNWNKNHTGNEKAPCVAMRGDVPLGFWDNLDCKQTNHFICQFGRQGYTTPPTLGTPWANIPCPPGWTPYEGFCYKTFCNATQTWMAALENCRNMGGDLPSVHSKGQDDFLTNFTQGTCATKRYFWFGMNDRDTEGGMLWSDGSPVDYTNWHPEEPNNWNGIEDCGIFTTHGYLWNDLNCYIPQSYVCSLPRGTQPITTPVPPTGVTNSQCGSDGNWVMFNSSCYLPSPPAGVNATLSWYDASAYCASHYATLVSIHSNRQMEFLYGTFSQTNSWIGLNILQGTAYQWSDGTPVDYSHWLPDEPNNYGGVENCVHLNKLGKWNDNLCQAKMQFICEKPLNGVATRAVPSPNPPGGCRNGFTRVPGGRNKCFFIGGSTVNTLKSFSDARDFCRGYGTGYDLASIEDLFEQEFLMTMTYGYNVSMWIGMSDDRGNNQFYWQNGAPVIFTNWDVNSPRSAKENNINKNIQNCVIMSYNFKGQDGKWRDVQCRRKFGFVCQSKQDASVPTMASIGSCSNPEYKSFRNTCYRVSSSAKTWSDAMTDCQADGGNLASINDAVESAYLVTIAARNPPYWIGLSDAKIAGLYSWIDGWPVSFTQWGPGQPQFSQASGYGCVFYDSKGNWNDTDCTNVFNYLCKISTATPPPTPLPTSGNCTSTQQVANGDYCYYISASPALSYPDASYSCSKMGMQLASVHSTLEMTFIMGLSQQYQPTDPSINTNLWIGLSKGFNGAFHWSDGTAVNFLNWAIGQPSTLGVGGQVEECVEMNKDDGRWDDISCFIKRGYICKTMKAFHSTRTPLPTVPATMPNHQLPRYSTYDIVDPFFTLPPPPVTQPYRPPQYINTNRIYPPGVTNAPPPFFMPTYTYPNQPSYNTQKPQQQIGSQSTSSSGGMSGGAIAGIIIAVIVIVAVAALLVVYMRKSGKLNDIKGALGFDNALYKNEPENIQL